MAFPNSWLLRWYFRHLQADPGKSMCPINFSGLFLKTQPNKKKKKPIKSVEEETCAWKLQSFLCCVLKTFLHLKFFHVKEDGMIFISSPQHNFSIQ